MNTRFITALFVLFVSPVYPLFTAEAGNQIANPAQPVNGIETRELTELWRAGGENDELFFGNVVQVIGDGAGRVFVLDVQMEQTHMFSPAGDLIATLGGHGEGPGEVNNINSIWRLGDDQLAQAQVMPGKVVNVKLWNGAEEKVLMTMNGFFLRCLTRKGITSTE